MANFNQALPAAFADLQSFVPIWGPLETAEARYLQRQASRQEDLRAFYDAMEPRIRDILSYLDGFPADHDLPAPEYALFQLALGLTEAAAAIEVYGAPCVPFVDAPHHVKIDWNDGVI